MELFCYNTIQPFPIVKWPYCLPLNTGKCKTSTIDSLEYSRWCSPQTQYTTGVLSIRMFYLQLHSLTIISAVSFVNKQICFPILYTNRVKLCCYTCWLQGTFSGHKCASNSVCADIFGTNGDMYWTVNGFHVDISRFKSYRCFLPSWVIH